MVLSSSHLGMLTSIMFGQIDDAQLHMTGCVRISWTGLDGEGNHHMEICKQRVSGRRGKLAAMHTSMAMARTLKCG